MIVQFQKGDIVLVHMPGNRVLSGKVVSFTPVFDYVEVKVQDSLMPLPYGVKVYSDQVSFEFDIIEVLKEIERYEQLLAEAKGNILQLAKNWHSNKNLEPLLYNGVTEVVTLERMVDTLQSVFEDIRGLDSGRESRAELVKKRIDDLRSELFPKK